MRDSPALDILPRLAAEGAVIKAYDPAAMDQAKPLLPADVQYMTSATECLQDADVAVVITEWNEFRALTPQSIKDVMRGNAIVDLRNIFDPAAVEKAGLTYQNIGRAGTL